MQVSENLTDNLVANGFSTSIQEDVFRYMIEQNLISLVAYEETPRTISSQRVERPMVKLNEGNNP